MHDRDVIVSGGEAVPCARCHLEVKGQLVGRPDHRACFGACHGAAPVAPRPGGKLVLDDDRKKLCTNCHAEAALVAPYTGKLGVAYPPYSIERDFGLTLGHKHHREVACTQCHAPKRQPPHQRCAGCHDGTAGRGPAMSACGACHPPAVGKPQPPELQVVQDTVTSEFSHAKHAARSAAGKDCTTCHAGIRDTDDSELPRPNVAACATCHDGRAAFATTTACTRCHTKDPGKFTVARPEARFAHTGPHAQLLKDQPCITCHVLARSGEVTVTGHAACASCHAADFGARTPKICGACHNATEPWRHLLADRPYPDATEFGANLDHGKHGGPCESCHALGTKTTQLRAPRGHVACTGAACHAVGSGPPPQLAACDGCHRLGLAAARVAKRATDVWSVRVAFDHKPHALPCTTCHVDLGSADVLALPAPSKPTCAPCHDGNRAFKLTGTTCTRCHLGTK